VRSIDSALLSAEDQDLADTEDTDSSVAQRAARRRFATSGHVINGATGNRMLDERRMTSARRANAVSAARRISSIANLQQVCSSSCCCCVVVFSGVVACGGQRGRCFGLSERFVHTFIHRIW